MKKLTVEQKQILFEQIRLLDPNAEIVKLVPASDYRSGSIQYTKLSGVVLYETIEKLTDEEYVRALLLTRLIKVFRYSPAELELEYNYTIGRPSPTKAQIDIRVSNRPGIDKAAARKGTKASLVVNPSRESVFMLIEAKAPHEYGKYVDLIEDQLFKTGNQEYSKGLRYVVWYSIEFRGVQPTDKCIIIDIRKYNDFKSWVEAGEPGHNLDLPADYGTVRKTKYVRGRTDLRTDLTRDELTGLHAGLPQSSLGWRQDGGYGCLQQSSKDVPRENL